MLLPVAWIGGDLTSSDFWSQVGQVRDGVGKHGLPELQHHITSVWLGVWVSQEQ